jgi:hypothetical protein
MNDGLINISVYSFPGPSRILKSAPSALMKRIDSVEGASFISKKDTATGYFKTAPLIRQNAMVNIFEKVFLLNLNYFQTVKPVVHEGVYKKYLEKKNPISICKEVII